MSGLLCFSRTEVAFTSRSLEDNRPLSIARSPSTLTLTRAHSKRWLPESARAWPRQPASPRGTQRARAPTGGAGEHRLEPSVGLRRCCAAASGWWAISALPVLARWAANPGGLRAHQLRSHRPPGAQCSRNARILRAAGASGFLVWKGHPGSGGHDPDLTELGTPESPSTVPGCTA